MAIKIKKPLMIFQSHLTKRFYITRHYKQIGENQYMVTGKKEDITEAITPY